MIELKHGGAGKHAGETDRPVLVTGHYEVLKGHCIRSNAGLYFDDYPKFSATLNYPLTHSADYVVMQENGKRYVEENYRWDVIVEKNGS